MSIHAPKPLQSKPGGHFIAFLILSVFASAILLAGLVLGTESRIALVRSGDRSFRVTGSNQFAGREFYSKTIEGVRDVVAGDAVRDRRGDSVKEVRRRRLQKHLAFYGGDGTRLGWDRVDDYRMINEFMSGNESSLELANPHSGWRMAAAWFCLGFGALTFFGAIQSSFFSKKKAVQ